MNNENNYPVCQKVREIFLNYNGNENNAMLETKLKEFFNMTPPKGADDPRTLEELWYPSMYQEKK